MSNGIEITGLDELIENFEEMEIKGKESNGKNDVSLDALFNKSFMVKYTSFDNFDLFLKEGGFEVETSEDFENIPEEKLDVYIEKETKFKNWDEMLGQAGEEYIKKKMFE
ncbi:uncharacterized protein CBO05P1_279 [Clostridium botulinum B str. Osaka05]|uniref:Uncharacterized protein n=1 Tax=Clostridium botulinum B str. Osaka05 TaxID=1407017 RepID=A0A060N8X4_CLOBO|nr:hypothetical protein [Clostridium botulinum]BAO04998.1 uncharacterized protein CBO05P1_279 [Clostridium botulinum B str. Osaka05]